MDLISVINRPGSKAFGLVGRKVVFDGVLILLLPPPHASYLMIIETIPTLCTLQYVSNYNGCEGYALSKCSCLFSTFYTHPTHILHAR